MGDDEGVECPFDCMAKDEQRTARAYGLFVAAMEADQRGDSESFKFVCDSADAFDYHIAAHAFMDLLEYLTEIGLVDPEATLTAYRERVNAWLAKA